MHFLDFKSSAQKHFEAMKSFFLYMLTIPSVSGNEEGLMRYLSNAFIDISDETCLIPVDDAIKNSDLYCNVKPEVQYSGRHNLVVTLKGAVDEKIVINAHADTVPAPDEMPEPYIKDEIVYGRGACDDKGQIAACFLLLMTFKELGIRPYYTVELHIVLEEEIGGNGTLALMNRDLQNVRSAIVMEPTNLKIITSARGAIWFKVTTKGISGHSGHPASTKSALLTGIRVMERIQEYHQRLLKKQKGTHPFEDFENPMPLTFGKLHSGEWPATVPKEAIIEGVLGFLPRKISKNIIDELNEVIMNAGSDIRDFTEMEYPFRRDPFVTARNNSEVVRFARAVRNAGISVVYSALPACCDGWFYGVLKRLPVMVFGAGEIRYAHSIEEQINLESIFNAAYVLFNFVLHTQGGESHE